MNEEIVAEIRKEYDESLKYIKKLTEVEVTGRSGDEIGPIGQGYYKGIVIDRLRSLQFSFREYKDSEEFKEIDLKFQKSLATLVNQVADFYDLQRQQKQSEATA